MWIAFSSLPKERKTCTQISKKWEKCTNYKPLADQPSFWVYRLTVQRGEPYLTANKANQEGTLGKMLDVKAIDAKMTVGTPKSDQKLLRDHITKNRSSDGSRLYMAVKTWLDIAGATSVLGSYVSRFPGRSMMETNRALCYLRGELH